MMKSRIAVVVLIATLAGTASGAPSEFPRLGLGWLKSVVARLSGGAATQPAKPAPAPAPAPKRVTVQEEAGCGEIGLACLAGDNISCTKFWICKAKHDPPQVW